MKKLITLLLITFPFVAWSVEQECGEGLEECRFVSKMCYTITDKQSNEVVDETCWNSNIPLNYASAIAQKYLHMGNLTQSGVNVFLKTNKAGSLVKALQAK